MSGPDTSHALEQFRKLLGEAWTDLSRGQLERIVRFYGLVLSENERQNLTRLTSPRDFLEGHVLDVRALLRSGLISFPAMDLGSGPGVPGLLAAILSSKNPWVLAESEGRKAEFLKTAADLLELDHVIVFQGRGEDYLKENIVSSVVARAVGPVERIFGWVRNCSTWNNLVLLKGPGWDEEWKIFGQSKYASELQIDMEYNYLTGEPPKRLRIVKLVRPPEPSRQKERPKD